MWAWVVVCRDDRFVWGAWHGPSTGWTAEWMGMVEPVCIYVKQERRSGETKGEKNGVEKVCEERSLRTEERQKKHDKGAGEGDSFWKLV